MKIVRHAPITRGVTELMYVGDDDAVDKATSNWNTMRYALMGIGALMFASSKSNVVKACGAAVGVAGYFAKQA